MVYQGIRGCIRGSHIWMCDISGDLTHSCVGGNVSGDPTMNVWYIRGSHAFICERGCIRGSHTWLCEFLYDDPHFQAWANRYHSMFLHKVSGDSTYDCLNSCMMTHTFRCGLIGINQSFHTRYQSVWGFHGLWDIQHTQSTATHCNTLQHTATDCNSLQHTATHCNTLQHTATHCNILQHTATHYHTLHHTAPHCAHTNSYLVYKIKEIHVMWTHFNHFAFLIIFCFFPHHLQSVAMCYTAIRRDYNVCHRVMVFFFCTYEYANFTVKFAYILSCV